MVRGLIGFLAASACALGTATAFAAAPTPVSLAAASPTARVDTACKLIGDRLRSLKRAGCRNAGLNASTEVTVRGQPILWRDFVPAGRKSPQRVLLVGGLHGDELSSMSIIFNWMSHELAQENAQPFFWRVVPCLNPDGLGSRPSRRMNAHGVDLNRNFPTPDWNQRAMPYWVSVTHKDPRRYPGQQPQSEPETRWLVQEIERFQPDAIVQVHAPYGVLDYDGPHEPPQNLGFLDLHLLGTYPGSLGNYAGVHLGLPVITLELPQAGKLPSQTQTDRLWLDLLSWLNQNLPPAAKSVPTRAMVNGNSAGGAAQ